MLTTEKVKAFCSSVTQECLVGLHFCSKKRSELSPWLKEPIFQLIKRKKLASEACEARRGGVFLLPLASLLHSRFYFYSLSVDIIVLTSVGRFMHVHFM